MKKGRLYLIPVPLGLTPVGDVLPRPVRDRARQLTHFVAENAKSARAFLKSLPTDIPLQQIEIHELNEHTPSASFRELLAPLLVGIDVGLVSEAGCPAVADPGASLVAMAHKNGIVVSPMIGPSSILLALMGSGLSGQNFSFHGYLPIKDEQRKIELRELEKESRREKRTQIFIEAPYRNKQMLESLVNICASDTKICIATDLTLESESIVTLMASEWRIREILIDRRPTVFLLQAS